jgi:uncharacterized protein YdaT
MPWTKKTYPVSMKNLPAAVRSKAIEIANALLDEKSMPEGIAIATAISRAKDWAVNHGKKSESQVKESRSTDVKKHGEDRYVVPHEGDTWAVKSEASNRVEKVFDSKQEAVKKASSEARKKNAAVTIQKRSGQIQKRVSYNPNRRVKKIK